MFDRLEALEDEFESILARLSDPDVFADQAAYVALTRRHRELEGIVAATRARRRALDDLATARDMLADSGAERDLAREEIAEAESAVDRLEEELRLG